MPDTGLTREDFLYLEREMELQKVIEELGPPNETTDQYPFTHTYVLQSKEKISAIFLDNAHLSAVYLQQENGEIEWLIDPPISIPENHSRSLSRAELDFIYPEISYYEIFIHIGPPDVRVTVEGSRDLLIYILGDEGRLILAFPVDLDCFLSAKFSPYSFNDEAPEFIDLFEPSDDYCK
jgi:hypothetical protein